MKPVIINVDDLGLSEPVNEAVIRLAQMQRIQAASYMSQGSISAHAVRELHNLNIDIGLHLDLTGFNCVGSLKHILLNSYLHLWPRTKIQNIINQQLNQFEDTIGQKPDFVDGHQHVHQFPVIRDILIRTLQQRYDNTVAMRITKPVQKNFKALLIYHLGGRALKKILQKENIAHNYAFAGVYDFNADVKQLASKWRQWLGAIPSEGAVIMCHPAIPSTSWHDEIKIAREREWQWLSSDAFSQCWQEMQCYATHWQTLIDKNDNHKSPQTFA
nr:ChbG/HpnK family deacetylase [Snodgrassella alvi]